MMVCDSEDLCYFAWDGGGGCVGVFNVTHMMVCDTGELSPHTQAWDWGFLLFIPVHQFRVLLKCWCCLTFLMALII